MLDIEEKEKNMKNFVKELLDNEMRRLIGNYISSNPEILGKVIVIGKDNPDDFMKSIVIDNIQYFCLFGGLIKKTDVDKMVEDIEMEEDKKISHHQIGPWNVTVKKNE